MQYSWDPREAFSVSPDSFRKILFIIFFSFLVVIFCWHISSENYEMWSGDIFHRTGVQLPWGRGAVPGAHRYFSEILLSKFSILVVIIFGIFRTKMINL